MGQVKKLLVSHSDFDRAQALWGSDVWGVTRPANADLALYTYMTLKHERKMHTENEHEYRYEERAGEYRLRCWVNGTEHTVVGLMESQPAWLQAIVATSRVGGHMKYTNEPPPDCIVWFVTDAEHNLLRFLELV